MLKRTLSLLMALALCLSMLPIGALAADAPEYEIESVQLKSGYLQTLNKTYDGARVKAPTVDDLVVAYKDGKTPPAGTTYEITSTTWKKEGTALGSAPSAAGSYTLEVGVKATIPTGAGQRTQASAQAVFTAEGDAATGPNAAGKYTVTIDSAIQNGTVTATVDQTSISSGDQVEPGKTVTLMVTPTEGYEMGEIKIIEDNAVMQYSTQTGNYYFVMPEGNVTITATFKELYNINVDKNLTNGNIELYDGVDTSYTAPEGSPVYMTVEPASGYKLNASSLKITKETDSKPLATSQFKLKDGETDVYEFFMPASDVTVTGEFVSESTPTIDLPTFAGMAEGEIANVTFKVDDEETTTPQKDNTVIIEITPPSGKVTETVEVTKKTVTRAENRVDVKKVADNQYTFTMPDSDIQVAVTFADDGTTQPGPDTYTVAVPTELVGGRVTADKASAAEKDTVTLTVAPDEGYKLKENSLTVTDASNNPVTVTKAESTENAYTFTMPASDVTVAAEFEEDGSATPADEHEVTVSSMSGGEITADPQKAKAGESVSLTVKPGTDNKLATLTVTDASGQPVTVEKQSETSYTFIMPNSNVTVAAEFKQAYTVAVASDIAHGTVNTQPDKAVAGETVVLIPKPEAGYGLKAFNVTYGTPQQTVDVREDGGVYSFVMPAGDVTVSATFEEAPYTITLEALTNGTATLSHESAAQGQTVTVTPVPNSGYQVRSVSYAPAGGQKTTITPVNGKYSFTMPAANVTVSVVFEPLPPSAAGSTATASFTIAPKTVTPVLKGSIVKPYDGNTALTVSATARPADSPVDYEKTGILSNDQGSVHFMGTFTFDSPTVGTDKTLTATDLAISGDAAGNYALAETTASTGAARITKGKITGLPSCTLILRNRREYTYTYDLKQMLPTLEEGELGEVVFTLGEVNITRPSFLTDRDVSLGADGETLTLKVSSAPYDRELEVGTVMVTIESENFEPVQNILQLKSANKTPVTVTGIEAANGTYDGSEKLGFTGTPSCVFTEPGTPGVPEVEEMAYTYKGIRGTVYAQSATPPTEPGTYQVTVSVPDSHGDYVGQWVGEFTIAKATVTIRVLDKTIKVDDPIPDLSNPVLGKDYTVSGLAPGHELRVPPTLEYYPLADSIMAGKFDILAADASVPNNTRYFPEITYIKGTLTVESVAPDVTLPFSDVSPDAWYANAVKYVYGYDMMSGVGSGLFGPTVLTSRGMLVSVLYRMEGRPAVWGSVDFEDVDESSFYYDAIRWASANRIISGYGNGKFGPDDNLTREQLAAILYNYTRYYKGINTNRVSSLDHFKDMDQIGDWAMRPVQWAYAQGLIVGRSDTVLAPKGMATRAEMASILMRYCLKICPPATAE